MRDQMAFDFTQDGNGNLLPDLTNENIGGVGLGLRIARDIFAFGNGLAPKMTPNDTAVPPIITPALGSPMPARPKQPASIQGCANTVVLLASQPAEATKSVKKGEAKGAARRML